ncbi:hypothetical protein GL279_05935 [Paracoccus limosus]|uniref:Uncharacterized protein n=1 Tax=Paracoccus limosus TaxID=913252 RepID=A0A844H3U1_9RHOB|nr:hypothetical protein [Paracoccus limosus]MTH34140.1 hypothetical protein [Paracoccus limosus]
MSDEDRYWSVRLIVYAFESEDEAREYQHKLVDAFCAMPESADLASTAGYFEGSSFDEIARLRVNVERLTASLAAEVEESERLRAALTDERRHGDELAAVLEDRDGGAHDGDCRVYQTYREVMFCDCGHVDTVAALSQHRARHRG